LLDDPAAELDRENLARLMAEVRSIPAQLWVTSLRAEIPGLPEQARMFHVERGAIRAA
jgi:recombinational DNA repair ATPase RecF